MTARYSGGGGRISAAVRINGELRDYGPVPEYHEAVRAHPGRPWTRRQFLDAVLPQGMLFAPGELRSASRRLRGDAARAVARLGRLTLRRPAGAGDLPHPRAGSVAPIVSPPNARARSRCCRVPSSFAAGVYLVLVAMPSRVPSQRKRGEPSSMKTHSSEIVQPFDAAKTQACSICRVTDFACSV
jgi:hypothetical protein